MTTPKSDRRKDRHATKLRGLRNVDDQLWEDFEAATRRANSDRSAELRRYIEWYVHREGATAPERPDAAAREQPEAP